MKAEHFWLTGDEDRPFIAMMVSRDVNIAAISSEMLSKALSGDIADTFNGLMSIPNLIGVIALSPIVVKLIRNYTARNIKGDKSVKPMLSAFPEVQEEQEKNL